MDTSVVADGDLAGTDHPTYARVSETFVGRMSDSGEEGARGSGADAVELVQSVSVELWIVTAVFFVAGDLLTTLAGLLRGGVAEVGPLVAPLMAEYGLVVMVPMKLLALLVCVLLWRLTPEPHAVGVPLGLAVFGVLVTGWNAGVILASLLPV